MKKLASTIKSENGHEFQESAEEEEEQEAIKVFLLLFEILIFKAWGYNLGSLSNN